MYALSLVAEHLANSSQPLVPERLFMANGNGENGHAAAPSQGLLGLLINLLVAEKSGFQLSDTSGTASLHEFAERMTREVMESMEQAAKAAANPPTSASALVTTHTQSSVEDPLFGGVTPD